MKYDLIILGCGPGGYRAAVKAAGHNLKTAVIDPEDMGGTCLNRGCVPTKLLLGSTSVVSHLKNQKKLRLAQGQAEFDLSSLQARKHSIIKASQKSMRASLESLGADIYPGRGRLASPKTVQAGDYELSAHNLILATGSRSGSLPGLKPDHKTILTSTDALELAEPPESLAIIGAGAVGIETGQIFHRLGTRITLIEAMNNVAPMEDELVSRELLKYLKREGWDVRLGSKVERVCPDSNGLKIYLNNTETVTAGKCLLAMGRLPNSHDLNLEAAEIDVLGPGWIKTDKYLMAGSSIYAIGDVNGISLYAHSAADQAEYVVDRIMGKTSKPYHADPMPSCLYGSMEVIRTGLGQKELSQDDASCTVTQASLAANTIVQSHGQVQGFIRVFWKDGHVAGITGVGCGLSSLITLAQVITEQKWTRQDARKYVFAHPTLDEALKEALLA